MENLTFFNSFDDLSLDSRKYLKDTVALFMKHFFLSEEECLSCTVLKEDYAQIFGFKNMKDLGGLLKAFVKNRCNALSSLPIEKGSRAEKYQQHGLDIGKRLHSGEIKEDEMAYIEDLVIIDICLEDAANQLKKGQKLSNVTIDIAGTDLTPMLCDIFELNPAQGALAGAKSIGGAIGGAANDAYEGAKELNAKKVIDGILDVKPVKLLDTFTKRMKPSSEEKNHQPKKRDFAETVNRYRDNHVLGDEFPKCKRLAVLLAFVYCLLMDKGNAWPEAGGEN